MDQFERADSTNLPRLENINIIEYMCSSDQHNVAEIRGAKVLLSSRDSYVDTAVGYVEVKRNYPECTVRAKVVPEHKVGSKQYVVTVTINEAEASIVKAECEDCAASAGGCKHSLVLMFWLEKRTSEPPSTSIQCYWNKPRLSNVRGESIKCEDIFPNSKKIRLAPKDSTVRMIFLKECKDKKITNSLATCFVDQKTSYNIFDLTVQYVAQNDDDDFDKYINFLNNQITTNVIEEINVLTELQANSKLWHSIRQGRVTASKIYEASKCKTDGALVQQILGGYKIPERVSIKRGKRLEKLVMKEVAKKLNKNIQNSGFILVNGIIGASPDGVGDDFVIEIKCPVSEKTLKNYISDGKITNKHLAQIQLQMHAAKKTKGVFCVADPSFEKNKAVHLYYTDYNKEDTEKMISEATEFWKTFLFKKVINSAKV